MNNTHTTLKIIGGILILVQLADILLHAATHQLDPARLSQPDHLDLADNPNLW